MNRDNQSSSEKLTALGTRLIHAARTSQTSQDTFDDSVTRFLGINRTDARCMDVVDRMGRITAGQLAIESGLTTGAVTVVIDRLEAAGYVRRSRDATDRRKVWIETTEIARTLVTRVFGHFEDLNPALLQRFTLDQVEAIMAFLEMSALINREQAAMLEHHIERGPTSNETRLIQARAYQSASEAHSAALLAALRATPRSNPDFSDDSDN